MPISNFEFRTWHSRCDTPLKLRCNGVDLLIWSVITSSEVVYVVILFVFHLLCVIPPVSCMTSLESELESHSEFHVESHWTTVRQYPRLCTVVLYKSYPISSPVLYYQSKRTSRISQWHSSSAGLQEVRIRCSCRCPYPILPRSHRRCCRLLTVQCWRPPTDSNVDALQPKVALTPSDQKWHWRPRTDNGVVALKFSCASRGAYLL